MSTDFVTLQLSLIKISFMLPIVHRGIAILLFLILFFTGIYFAKEFLVPLILASFIAMVFLPLCRWFEGKGLNRALSALFCVIIFLLFVTGVIFLVSWQVGNFAEDTHKLQQMVLKVIDNVKNFAAETLGIPREQQKQMVEDQKKSGGEQAGKIVMLALSSISSVIINFVLITVYLFLLLFFRGHLKQFLTKIFSGADKKSALTVMYDASKVGQNYLTGMAFMIVVLWIMYGIGFSIVGVKYAIFFAVLCGLLEIVPFIGNLTGTSLTVLMAISQGANSSMVIGILVTYAIVQFIQTYLLEPLVVGSKVNINPLFTIIVLVLGEMVWGIAGMVLAIPLLGIIKIIFDHVTPLKPYGYLIGETKESKEDSAFVKKIKSIFTKG